MHWWQPPKQRQRWGDSKILPSSSLGQIFFDLFFVGGAINLGNILKTTNDARGILYFCGAGFPMVTLWFDKMHFDARFTTRPGHDVIHRLLDIVQIACVATALSRLRPTNILSDECQHADMFEFSLSLLLSSVITIYRYMEVMAYVVGDPAAKVAARRDIGLKLIPTCFYLLATCESSFFYFGNQDSCYHNDRPICFCLAAWVSWAVIGYLGTVKWSPKHRMVEISVPMNIHFCMHRYGEWFMLMFGESIVSLLIVDGHNETLNYNIAFFSGILSVIFFAHMHFVAQPRQVDAHALSRSRHSSYLYMVIVPIYSVALIAIGVAYKMFLYEFIYGNGAAHRFLGGGGGEYDAGEYGADGGGGDNHGQETDYTYYESQEIRQQFAANLFSGSLATAFICADVMQLLHKGVRRIWEESKKIPKLSLLTFILLKVFLLGMLGALIVFQNDPHIMALSGLVAIVLQQFMQRFFSTGNSDDSSKQTLGKEDGDNKRADGLSWLPSVPTFDDDMSFRGKSRSLMPRVVLALFEREQLASDKDGSLIPTLSNEPGVMDGEDEYTPNYSRMTEMV